MGSNPTLSAILSRVCFQSQLLKRVVVASQERMQQQLWRARNRLFVAHVGYWPIQKREQRASTVTQVDERGLFLSPKTARPETSHLETGKLGEIRKVRLPSKS